MDPQVYDELALQENDHWWFVARRVVVLRLLKTFSIPPDATVLDAGCGAGGNLALLATLGKVFAFEMHDASRARAQARGIGEVAYGKLPDDIPFSGTNFDLITLFDVLEHVKHDDASLAALAARLKPGGILFINVPAYPFLFGRVDELHQHFRRYRLKELKQQVAAAGLEIAMVNHWNFFLFPVALVVRFLERVHPPKGYATGMKKPSPLVNMALIAVISLERFLVPYVRLPFGLSILLVARKPR